MKPSIVLAGVFLAAASILAACEDDLVLVQAQTRQVEIEKQKPEEAVPDKVEPEVQEPTDRADFFRQRAAKVDILWVIDSSPTMKDEQEKLAANFKSFISFMESSGVDYQLGVTDMDLQTPGRQGALQGSTKIITSSMQNREALFAANVKLPSTGNADEQGFTAAVRALTPPLITGVNKGFLRPEAALFIIFVSDEDDKSPGPIEHYYRFFEQLKGPGNENIISISGIVIPFGGCPQGTQVGARFSDLAKRTGGLQGNLCASDFSKDLESLGFSAAGLKERFPLSDAPEPDTLRVEVDGKQVDPPAWSYQADKNVVVFARNSIPKSNATVKISYTLLGKKPT
ncbi:MAG: hypothetical protein GMKNLPBB_00240 [Myxococcota bacterium]|nr:hypothetical protein [Myxococcota bacterium]